MSLNLKLATGWKKIDKFYVKLATGWKEIDKLSLKTTAGWKEVFAKVVEPPLPTETLLGTLVFTCGTGFDAMRWADQSGSMPLNGVSFDYRNTFGSTTAIPAPKFTYNGHSYYAFGIFRAVSSVSPYNHQLYVRLNEACPVDVHIAVPMSDGSTYNLNLAKNQTEYVIDVAPHTATEFVFMTKTLTWKVYEGFKSNGTAPAAAGDYRITYTAVPTAGSFGFLKGSFGAITPNLGPGGEEIVESEIFLNANGTWSYRIKLATGAKQDYDVVIHGQGGIANAKVGINAGAILGQDVITAGMVFENYFDISIVPRTSVVVPPVAIPGKVITVSMPWSVTADSVGVFGYAAGQYGSISPTFAPGNETISRVDLTTSAAGWYADVGLASPAARDYTVGLYTSSGQRVALSMMLRGQVKVDFSIAKGAIVGNTFKVGFV